MAPPQIHARRLAGLVAEAADADQPRGPAYRSLADRLRSLVTDGRISPGSRLPSERDLTDALGVSRTTVTAAYRHLRERGYLQSRRGAGSFITLPTGAHTRTSRALAPGTAAPDVVDLTCASLPAAPGVAAAFEAAVADLPRLLRGAGYHPLGLPELRQAVAERYDARGLPTSPDQVLVTTGALSGVVSALRVLVSPGDRALVEAPTYPNAIEALRRSGARAVTSPVDGAGWHLPTIEAILRQAMPTAAYLLPDFHNPTGMLLDHDGRERLARALARSRATAIVDETLVDLSIDVPDDDMPPPFAAFDPDRVITVGGASKTYWGGLRIGWIRAPERLVTPLLDARASLDLSAPPLEQLVLTRLLSRRAEIVTHQQALLRERRAAAAAAVATHLPGWTFHLPPGGLALWCRMPEPVSGLVADLGEAHGVRLAAGNRFSADGTLGRFLRIPFVLDTTEVDDTVQRIAAAYAHALRSAPARRSVLIA